MTRTAGYFLHRQEFCKVMDIENQMLIEYRPITDGDKK